VSECYLCAVLEVLGGTSVRGRERGRVEFKNRCVGVSVKGSGYVKQFWTVTLIIKYFLPSNGLLRTGGFTSLSRERIHDTLHNFSVAESILSPEDDFPDPDNLSEVLWAIRD
jgi:hypothetical protein